MTVRTSNIALRDLEEYSIPRLVGRQDYTVVSFETGIAMIEVKNDDVGLPAVDAWMSPEVLADQGAVLIAIPSDPGDLLPDVRGAISHVMLAPGRPSRRSAW
jgi:hypothetical protein